jgi:hypothetical protein
MYSRGICSTVQDHSIPEKYDGTALLDIPTDDESTQCNASSKFIDAQKKEIKFSPHEAPKESAEEATAEVNDTEPAGIFSFGPMKWVKSILPGSMNIGGILPKIELEELIIIGLALYLFFSKSGDKECALILLALIFIK